jgi:hypothetical protein
MQDGVLEISGPEQSWVDGKVEQLTPLLTEPTSSQGAGGGQQNPSGRDSSKARQRSKTTNADTKTSQDRPRKRSKPTINEDLRGQLKGDAAKDLHRYITERQTAWASSKTNQAAIIAGFLQDHLNIDGVDMHDLYTVYSVLGERPGNTRSQLVNARQRTSYFGSAEDGKVPLSIAGENFAKFDSLDSANES